MTSRKELLLLRLPTALLVVGRVAVVLLRPDLHSLGVECFKDVAHVYVGGLLGAGAVSAQSRPVLLGTALFLIVVEVVAAVVTRI